MGKMQKYKTRTLMYTSFCITYTSRQFLQALQDHEQINTQELEQGAYYNTSSWYKVFIKPMHSILS